jgi:hypothetical protein
MSAAAEWLGRLQGLAVRFNIAGIGPDLAGLTLAEAWGVFMFLQRLATECADAS